MFRAFVLFSCCVVLCLANEDGIPISCAPNEEIKCVRSCPPEKTCRNRDIHISCLAVYEPCQHKCVCKEGYSRNFLGECITNEQCATCSSNNEFYSCGGNCDTECPTRDKQNRTNCPITTGLKQPVCRCYCDDGYARDENRNCIPVEKCPPIPTCEDPNEEYMTCQRDCPPDVCFSMLAFYDCRDTKCKPGCSCRYGYLRDNATSPCMKTCECPQVKGYMPCN